MLARRIFTASLVALGLAATGATAVSAAGPATATPTVSTVQVAAPQTVPAFYCAGGIVDTICQTVLGPICKSRCMSAPQAQPAAPATTSTRTSTAATPAIRLPLGDLCTIKVNPNPFCLIP